MRRTALPIGLMLAMASSNVPAMEKPNFIIIIADDLGRADCGFMGSREIRTPHIDKLAASGAVLDAFYVQPVCSPTRAAFLTGRYPMRHGLQVGVVRPWADYGLPTDERTLATALQEAGYITGIFGKWHLGHAARDYLPTRRGFHRQYGHYNGAIDYFTHVRDGGFDWHRDDTVCRDEGYSTELIGREAAQFISEHAGKKPFFAYVPFNAVHTPLQAPKRYLDTYPDLQGQRKIYAAMVTAMDDAVGEIIRAVDNAGIRDHTFIVFCSDNGGPSPGKITDNGPYRAGKATLYEGGVRVVACASWRGKIRPGSVVTEPMHIVDLFPTITKRAGATTTGGKPLDGVDVWPTLAEGQPSPRTDILLNAAPTTGAIRVGDWKLVINGNRSYNDQVDPKTIKNMQLELFNLKTDPYEKTNLANSHPERVTELQTRYHHYASQAIPPKIKPEPANFTAPKIWGEFASSSAP